MYESLEQHYLFAVGYTVLWEGPQGVVRGRIEEIRRFPAGVRFWLSCAPYWVRPEEVHFLDWLTESSS